MDRKVLQSVQIPPSTNLIKVLSNSGYTIESALADIVDNSIAHFANEITLPLHTCLTDEDVAYVIEKYTEILKEYI